MMARCAQGHLVSIPLRGDVLQRIDDRVVVMCPECAGKSGYKGGGRDETACPS